MVAEAGRFPVEHAPDAHSASDRMNGQPPAQLLAALAEVGVAADDYALILRAKELVDEVNRRLRERRSNMVYVVTFCAAPRPFDNATAMEAPPRTR